MKYSAIILGLSAAVFAQDSPSASALDDTPSSASTPGVSQSTVTPIGTIESGTVLLTHPTTSTTSDDVRSTVSDVLSSMSASSASSSDRLSGVAASSGINIMSGSHTLGTGVPLATPATSSTDDDDDDNSSTASKTSSSASHVSSSSSSSTHSPNAAPINAAKYLAPVAGLAVAAAML